MPPSMMRLRNGCPFHWMMSAGASGSPARYPSSSADRVMLSLVPMAVLSSSVPVSIGMWRNPSASTKKPSVVLIFGVVAVE